MILELASQLCDYPQSTRLFEDFSQDLELILVQKPVKVSNDLL